MIIDATAISYYSRRPCNMFKSSLCIPYFPTEHATRQDQQTNESNHRAHNDKDKRVGDREFQTIGCVLETGKKK